MSSQPFSRLFYKALAEVFRPGGVYKRADKEADIVLVRVPAEHVLLFTSAAQEGLKMLEPGEIQAGEPSTPVVLPPSPYYDLLVKAIEAEALRTVLNRTPSAHLYKLFALQLKALENGLFARPYIKDFE